MRDPRSTLRLPRTYPAAAHHLLAQAERLALVLEIAGEDDGASVDAGSARERREVLRSFAAAVRRARVAAVNAPLDEIRPAARRAAVQRARVVRGRQVARPRAAGPVGPLGHQVGDHRDDPRVLPGGRRPLDRQARAPVAAGTASVSRSYATSMWSLTNPIGTTTAPAARSAASRVSTSPTSGSSHGTCGGPDRDCHASSHSRPSASATSLAVSRSWASYAEVRAIDRSGSSAR